MQLRKSAAAAASAVTGTASSLRDTMRGKWSRALMASLSSAAVVAGTLGAPAPASAADYTVQTTLLTDPRDLTKKQNCGNPNFTLSQNGNMITMERNVNRQHDIFTGTVGSDGSFILTAPYEASVRPTGRIANGQVVRFEYRSAVCHYAYGGS
jgi:hypothetical protein